MSKVTRNLWKGLALLMVLSLVLASCAPAATPTAQPTTPPQPTKSAPPTTAPTAVPTSVPTAAPAATAAPTAEPAMPVFVSKPTAHVMPDGYVCPEPQPKMTLTSKEVNLFVWTEYIPQDTIDCFEAVYGIKVNRDEYSANEEMTAKLLAGSTNYDLVQPTDYTVKYMIRQGLLQKMDKNRLTILGNFAVQYMNQPFDPNNEYTVPYEAGTDAIVVNTAKVKDVPKSWADLWNPEYAGRIVLLDDSRATIGAVLLTLGYDVNTKDPAQLDAAKTKLAELVKNVKLFDSDSPKTALIAGDVDLGMVWTGEALAAQQAVPTIKYVYPTEGAILWQDNYAIPKNAPHLDTAYAWLNYSLQPDVFWLMLRDYAYTNPNQATLDFARTNLITVKNPNDNNADVTTEQLYKIYFDSPITNTPPDALKAAHRIDDVGDATPLYDKIWTEVKGQ
jgi:spermidine/putrescine-binding protein